MKLKKIIVLLTTVCILGGLVACGENKTNDVDKNNVETQGDETVNGSEDKENENVQSTEITLEVLLEHEATPEEDFMCSGTDTEQYINVYKGSDEIVVIPETISGLPVTVVDGYTFANDSSVKALKFADSIKTIGQSVCGLNNNLQIVVCGTNLETIGAGVFQMCESLEEVQLNEGLKTIEDWAFSNCTSLKELYIPSSVEYISFSAFIGTELTIFGEAGSYVETFCTENEIKFEAVE